MGINVIRRVTGYVAVPVVSAGIVGAAALGLAGIASAGHPPRELGPGRHQGVRLGSR